MVLFILTRAGFEDMRPLVNPTGGPVWINAGVLTDEETNSLREAGVDLTRFSNAIDPRDWQEIVAALSTVALHHPGDRIFVEMLADDEPWD